MSLTNAEYQTLPVDVWNVFIGPNNRHWYAISKFQRGKYATVEQVKKVIEGEFKKDAPHILDCKLLFFEKGGRVWFSPFHEDRIALGYDGTRWIEKRATSRFMGYAPNHGKFGRSSQNVLVDGKIFFAHPFGISWFDGKRWGYNALNRKHFDHMQFLPGSDKKSFVVLCVGAPTTEMWRFNRDKWKQRSKL